MHLSDFMHCNALLKKKQKKQKLHIRADSDNIIKPCLKTTCTHFNEITCTKVISYNGALTNSLWVLNPNIRLQLTFSQDIITADFLSSLSFMLLWILFSELHYNKKANAYFHMDFKTLLNLRRASHKKLF